MKRLATVLLAAAVAAAPTLALAQRGADDGHRRFGYRSGVALSFGALWDPWQPGLSYYPGRPAGSLSGYPPQTYVYVEADPDAAADSESAAPACGQWRWSEARQQYAWIDDACAARPVAPLN